MNQKWINSNVNCEAYSSFQGIFSDYRIILGKICLSLQRNKTVKASQYNLSSFTDNDIKNHYTVRNKFDSLQETSTKRHTPDDKYKNFVSIYIEVASEWIPIQLWKNEITSKYKRNPTNANA